MVCRLTAISILVSGVVTQWTQQLEGANDIQVTITSPQPVISKLENHKTITRVVILCVFLRACTEEVTGTWTEGANTYSASAV
uniref:Esag12 n=1 Tax=Trypanosoma brucei brucei (strain 927/4 GUTat10.1) TaxID=185431 RepID=G1CRP6_TRYB2|nr:esag12 [Trypanosoma brucei brucei TREU927]AEL79565.1 esag12 [Trypanosoma brucei brucei TREU927]